MTDKFQQGHSQKYNSICIHGIEVGDEFADTNPIRPTQSKYGRYVWNHQKDSSLV